MTGADSFDQGQLWVSSSKHIAKLETPRAGLSAQPVGHDLLILDKRNSRIHRLNQTASAIWRNIEAGIDTDGIVQEIVERFDVSPEAALADVQGILHEFRALDLLNAAGTEL